MLNGISAANLLSAVEPIAQSFEACAAMCDSAGIGGHISQGHAAIARGLAADIRAAAAKGKLPDVYQVSDWAHAAADDQPRFDPAVAAILDQFR